jgi:hypothetical protein
MKQKVVPHDDESFVPICFPTPQYKKTLAAVSLFPNSGPRVIASCPNFNLTPLQSFSDIPCDARFKARA